jgi:hypothetical protein
MDQKMQNLIINKIEFVVTISKRGLIRSDLFLTSQKGGGVKNTEHTYTGPHRAPWATFPLTDGNDTLASLLIKHKKYTGQANISINETIDFALI